MQCHKCEHFGKFEGQAWEKTPCAKCILKNDASHSRGFNEAMEKKEEEEDLDAVLPFQGMTGTDDDPMVPLSVLAKAMACWVSTTLPAREVFKMRMCKKTLEEIAREMGVRRWSVHQLLSRAIKDNPVMASLLSGGKEHRQGRKRTSLKPRKKYWRK